jgi:hypothetical protein
MAFATRTPRGAKRHLGFTCYQQAGHDRGRIEFVILRTSLHLPLLSTPSLDDAVTIGYKALTNFDGDLHPADSVRL